MFPPAAPRRVLALGAWALAGLVVVAGLGVAGVSYYAADKLVHPPRVASDATPAERGLAYERVLFTARDGVRLVGWWMPAEAEARGTVVFLHGYGASKQQSLSVAGFLHRAGYHVLAFDFRAHGESGGDHTTVGVDEVRDVLGALDWLGVQPGVDPDRVALFGWSMGAATAINAAASAPHVRAIVADSSFTSLADVAARALGSAAGLPERPFGDMALTWASWMTHHSPADDEPVRAVRDVHRPILLIQGLADRLLQPTDGRELKDAAGDEGELWLVPDAPHLDAHRYYADEYEQRVVAFLEASLA